MNKSSITKHVKRLFMSLFMVIAMGQFAYAQQTITGTVSDAETGSTLVGATVQIQGTTRGTITDVDGNYKLSASEGETLAFSFIGYEKQMVTLTGQSTVNVALQPSAESLGEVVVIGYGTQKKDDNTGSVTAISSEDFNEGAITSPEELFRGKTAGVDVTSNSGAPGAGATIRIRGGSSLSASNDPLFVIDGVPVDGGDISGMRNPLNSINPNDIASVTVLKDASATAIYGSRASNGVILITTKRGRKGQEMKINYTGKASVQTIRDQVDVLSADEFREVITDVYGQSGADFLGSANTDWQDEIYDNAFSQDHNLSVTGAIKNLPYRASIGYSGNEGILRTSKLDRITGSVSVNPTFLDDALKMDVNLKGMQVQNRFANSGAIGAAAAFDPTRPVMDPDANSYDKPYGGYFTWRNDAGNRIPIATSNPVAMLEQTEDQSTVNRALGNMKLDYALPFIPDFSAVLNLGFDYSDVADGLYLVPENAAFEDDGSDYTGVRRNYTQKKENELLDFYLKYNADYPSIESRVDFTGGYSWEHHYEESSEFATNYNRADSVVVDQDTEFKTEYYLVSFFGRMNYTLKEKYLLTATLRYDGTSRFHPDNRWGLFPSAALAWKMHEESFLENVEILDQLKLRLGYGVTGQQNINQGNYPYLASYMLSEPNARYQFGDEFITTLRPGGYNANLKWEETTTYNLALDYSFYGERLIGSIEAYYRETNDLLNVIPTPLGTNFTNRILSNVGTLEIQGIEMNVTGRPISEENMFWEIGFNASYNENEITKLTTVDDPDYIGVETGGISGGVGNTIQIHSVGFPRSSFLVYEQVYDQNGDPVEGLYADRDGNGVINEDDKYRFEKPTADYTFGISSRFNYEEWDFSFSGRANIGNYVYNNVASMNGNYREMFFEPLYMTNAVTSIQETRFMDPRYHSDHYVEDASFFRMDNITLGYTFEDLANQITSLRISATVQNAFIITEYSGIDPEVFGGIDNNMYPRPRTFMLGVNLNF